MLKIDFTEKTIDQVYQQFMEHPSGVTKKKLHVVYLKALGLAHQDIERIARTSADSVTRYLKDYNEGGLAALGVSRTHSPVSSLLPYQEQIKSHFLKQPPHTVVEASHEIEVLTGRCGRSEGRYRPHHGHYLGADVGVSSGCLSSGNHRSVVPAVRVGDRVHCHHQRDQCADA